MAFPRQQYSMGLSYLLMASTQVLPMSLQVMTSFGETGPCSLACMKLCQHDQIVLLLFCCYGDDMYAMCEVVSFNS